ncbi:hypothetical protein ABZS83_32980 [Streptomyces sp. NPDC005426]|uniref:hypothetical protein n=1 Tax=Streptomyces sp. NPDC005426 TaxID=3155344 RepID=UPI0033A966B6
MTDPDEQRVRTWLRRAIDGPPAEEQPKQVPLVEVHVIPQPDNDHQDDQDDDQEDDQDEEQPEPDRPWWHVRPGPFGTRPRAPEPVATPQETIAAAPGIHVTVNQPAAEPQFVPSPEDEWARERRHRRRVWLAYHGGAAGVGWYTGLADAMADLLNSAGPGAPAAGIAMAAVTYVIASYLPGLPYMPPALRPVTAWAARIPVCTAVLALALHAPGTL